MKNNCYNCQFSGAKFKIKSLTHMHCEHPKHKPGFEYGELCAWDTLREFWDTCEDFKKISGERNTDLMPLSTVSIKPVS